MFLALTLASWAPFAMIVTGTTGCDTTAPGLLKPISAPVEHTITNTVTIIAQTAPSVLPAPYGTAVEAVAAAILAALAAWQANTHAKVSTLEKNNPVQNIPPKV